MKRVLSWVLLLVAVAAAAGCAHPISVTADTAALTAAAPASRIDRKVGLVISEEQRSRQVTTPGGGGDKVSYQPYRDLETGLYVVLSQVFAGTTLVTGANDPKVKADGLNLLVHPEVTTTSHSPSPFTWPPTIFTVELDCTIKDTSDKPLRRIRVQGEGRAEFDEFKADFSLSAKRAALDALKKLMAALVEARAALQ